MQPSSVTWPGVHVTCTGPSQASVAVTSAQAGGVGLQPRSPPSGRLSNTGTSVSTFHVYVTTSDPVLPQASVAEYVNFWLRMQPSGTTSPGVQWTSTVPSQLSDAVTSVAQAGGVGLQPRSPPVGRFASTGFVRSSFHV